MTRLLLILGTLSLATAALATTYVRVEKDGTKTYSDRPIPGGQPIELEKAQTYSAPASASGELAPNLPQEQRLLQQIDDFNYTACGVTPANDETFTNPETVPITVTLAPGLRPGDVVTLTVDGKVVGTNILNHVMQPVYRGTHSVLVTVKDGFGRTLCSSSTAFHVMRPTINSPGRR
jgi:hypothetical protein